MVQPEAPSLPGKFGDQMRRSSQSMQRDMWEWDLCLRFLGGHQNLAWNEGAGFYTPFLSQPGRNATVTNLILPMYRVQVARLDVNYPCVAVKPASASWQDLSKAISSEEAFRYVWQAKDTPKKLRQLNEWLVAIGNGGLHTFWDEAQGDFRTRVLSGYDIRFEAGITDPDESAWCAVRQVTRKDDLKATYPEAQEQIDSLHPMITAGTARRTASGQVPDDRIEVWDVYFADGRWGVWVDDAWLWSGTIPAGCKPVQFVRYCKIPGRVHGIGLIRPLIDLQRSFNRNFNAILDMTDTMSNPIWKVPTTCDVSQADLTNVAGQIVRYNPVGGEPKREGGESVEQHMYENLTRIHAQMMDVAGIHSNALGRRAVGVNSGVAIGALVDQDTAQLTQTMESIEDAVKALFSTVVTIMQTWYDEGRMVQMFDKDGGVVWRSLSATSLSATPDIHIEAGSLFKGNQEDLDAKVWSYVQVGAMSPQEARELTTMRVYDKDRMQRLVDANVAQAMLKAATDGMPVEWLPGDNVPVIAKVFREFMQSPEYYAGHVAAKQMGDVAEMDRTAAVMQHVRDLYITLVTNPALLAAAPGNQAAPTPLASQPAPQAQGEVPAGLQDTTPQGRRSEAPGQTAEAMKSNQGTSGTMG